MLSRSKDLKKIKAHDSLVLWLSEFDSKKISVAVGLINGRHPETGKTANMKCEEAYYVLNGNGTIHSEKGKFKIKKR